MKEIRIHK